MKPENIEHKSNQHTHWRCGREIEKREEKDMWGEYVDFLDKFGLCWYSGCASVRMWVLFRVPGI